MLIFKFKMGDRVIFRPTDSDRRGQDLEDTVIGCLGPDDADEEVGPMYRLERNGDAFEDELELKEADNA
jgi:hypothetical protein